MQYSRLIGPTKNAMRTANYGLALHWPNNEGGVLAMMNQGSGGRFARRLGTLKLPMGLHTRIRHWALIEPLVLVNHDTRCWN